MLPWWAALGLSLALGLPSAAVAVISLVLLRRRWPHEAELDANQAKADHEASIERAHAEIQEERAVAALAANSAALIQLAEHVGALVGVPSKLDELTNTVSEIKKQVFPNGGGSINDRVAEALRVGQETQRTQLAQTAALNGHIESAQSRDEEILAEVVKLGADSTRQFTAGSARFQKIEDALSELKSRVQVDADGAVGGSPSPSVRV